jgi:leucyl-tRNA synthetase
MQRNWIGRSEGATLSFAVESNLGKIEVFTTRVDTLFGATYLAIAPEHPLLTSIIAGRPEEQSVKTFCAGLRDKPELDRTQLADKQGVFTGALARNPLSGERIPIWVTDYVLAEYGTGAVMGVPAHDQRDFEFARANRLPIKTVIKPADAASAPSPSRLPAAFVDDGVLVHSGEFSGMTSAQARKAMTEKLVGTGVGTPAVNYKLRDWLISRDRYWGAPIPMVRCPRDGYVPVPEDQLPVLLPDSAPITGTHGSPLAHVPEFMNTTCPKCGGPATREPETMDTFVCSSWYYLRYLSAHDSKAPWELDAARYWAPVDQYVGGIEHAVLHLMYARFFYKVLSEEKLVPADEPFLRLFNQGMVLGENHEKMSKSRGNTVSIDDAVSTYGGDALRLFEMFAGPPESDFPWSTTGIAGATRTLQRIWRLILTHAGSLASNRSAARGNGRARSADEVKLRRSVHAKIKQVGDELGDRLHLNTSVAAIMTLLNDIEDYASKNEQTADSPTFAEALRTLLLLLAPFAPHMTEELWEKTGHSGSIHDQPWPKYDESALQRALLQIVVQVNGKRRGVIEGPPGLDEQTAFEQAKIVDTVAAQLNGKTVRKRVYVKDRLLNIVVS